MHLDSSTIDYDEIEIMYGVSEVLIEAVIDGLRTHKLPITNGHICAHILGQSAVEQKQIQMCQVCGSILPHIDSDVVKRCLRAPGGVQEEYLPYEIIAENAQCPHCKGKCVGHKVFDDGLNRTWVTVSKHVNSYQSAMILNRIQVMVFDGCVYDWKRG